jgi:hypothetical protein
VSKAKISSAIVFRNSAFAFPDILEKCLKASVAKATAWFISSEVASVKTASLSVLVCGLKVLYVFVLFDSID